MEQLYRTFTAVAAAALVALTSAAAMAQSPALLRVLGASPDAKSAAKMADTAVVKARVARPDVAALDDIARHHVATQHKERFVIDLFPGLELEAEVVAAEARPDGTTLFARLTEIELGSAAFTMQGGVLTATVDFPGGSYVITPQADGHHQVAQKAAQLFAPERAPRSAFPVLRPKSAFGTKDLTVQDVPTDSGRLIDVMAIWTPAAESAAGGLAAMQNLAQAAVDSSNLAFLNSGIAQRFRLVHGQQLAYGERTNCAGGNAFDCALDDLTFDGDGYLDAVHALRDVHGADLVALLIHDSAYCGLAWLPNQFAPELGFSVTAHNCAVGNKSFAHELGHNLGAHHDPWNADASGPQPFNKGYISPQLNWRTIMAYGGPCNGCTRLSNFSNPKLTLNGAAMGTAAVSNNAHVLNSSAKTIANYRPTSALHPIPARFTDVPTSHPFFGHIEFLAQANITSGCSAGMFCPTAPVSRRAMAAFLERSMRASNWVPPTTTTVFTDVVPGSPFAGEIEALRTDGVTGGCGSGTYCPEQAVTRGQMAVFLLRARCGAGYVPNPPVAQTFADVPLSHPFASYIDKLYSLGITAGCTMNPLRFCPDNAVTRAQMAVYVERAYPFVTPSEACAL